MRKCQRAFRFPVVPYDTPVARGRGGEKKKTESTIFSNLTKSVIGWESLALIGRRIIICPLSGRPVRSQEEGEHFSGQKKRNVLDCGVCVCVCESVSDGKREEVLKSELRGGNQKGKTTIRFCVCALFQFMWEKM